MIKRGDIVEMGHQGIVIDLYVKDGEEKALIYWIPIHEDNEPTPLEHIFTEDERQKIAEDSNMSLDEIKDQFEEIDIAEITEWQED